MLRDRVAKTYDITVVGPPPATVAHAPRRLARHRAVPGGVGFHANARIAPREGCAVTIRRARGRRCEGFAMPEWTKTNFGELRDVSPQEVRMQWRFARDALHSPELGVSRFTHPTEQRPAR